MKVATKIVLLAATLVIMLAVVLALHVWSLQRLANVTGSLPVTLFRVGTATLELDRQAAQLVEFTRKLAVAADYQEGTDALRASFQDKLRALAALDLAPEERRAVAGLQAEWQRYRVLPPLRDGDAEIDAERTATHLARLRATREALAKLADASEAHLARQRRSADRSVVVAKRLSWMLVGGATLLALALLAWTIRSIHRPLQRLTAGTRDVADGRFALELDTSSGDELAEVAAAFNRMVDRLRELDALKRDFLSHVSHELNTPLVAMRETNELLLDELAGPLGAEQRRMLELNREGALRLSRMITKILDLTRLEAGAMEYEFAAIDLDELIRRVVAEFAAAAQERDIVVEYEPPAAPVHAHGDRDRLLQVLENVLSNALKFAPRRSVVRIALATPPPATGFAGRLDRRGRRAVITIADRGPGVPEADREAIFQKFHRGGRQGGSGFGLGLAISREIVEANGGRMWVRDNPPGGSIFGIDLAIAPAPQQQAQAGAAG